MFDSKNKLIVFGKCEFKNWTFLKKKKGSNKLHSSMWLKEFDLLYTTKRMKLFSVWRKELSPFFIMTRRIEHPFWICLNELNPFVDDSKTFSKKKKTFKNWTFRKMWLKGLNFSEYDSKNWTFLFWIDTELRMIVFNMTQSIQSSFFNLTQRIEYDSKHWTLFFNMSQRIEPSFPLWLKELNFFWTWITETFLNYNSKNWTFC